MIQFPSFRELIQGLLRQSHVSQWLGWWIHALTPVRLGSASEREHSQFSVRGSDVERVPAAAEPGDSEAKIPTAYTEVVQF
jgi:hypothetical protein